MQTYPEQKRDLTKVCLQATTHCTVTCMGLPRRPNNRKISPASPQQGLAWQWAHMPPVSTAPADGPWFVSHAAVQRVLKLLLMLHPAAAAMVAGSPSTKEKLCGTRSSQEHRPGEEHYGSLPARKLEGQKKYCHARHDPLLPHWQLAAAVNASWLHVQRRPWQTRHFMLGVAAAAAGLQGARATGCLQGTPGRETCCCPPECCRRWPPSHLAPATTSPQAAPAGQPPPRP